MTSRIVIQFAGWRKYQSNADDFPSLCGGRGDGCETEREESAVSKSFSKVHCWVSSSRVGQTAVCGLCPADTEMTGKKNCELSLALQPRARTALRT